MVQYVLDIPNEKVWNLIAPELVIFTVQTVDSFGGACILLKISVVRMTQRLPACLPAGTGSISKENPHDNSTVPS
jgi:hypothetical protein